jgi:polysaccharide transporter, PST family
LQLEIRQKSLKKFNLSFFEKHKLLKVLSLNALAVLVQFVLGIFSVRIVSEFLGPSGMALTGNFRSFTTLFKSISVLGLKEGLIKLFLENTDNNEENNRVVSSFLVFFLGFSFFLSILIVLFAEPLSSYLFQTTVFSVYLNYFALLLPFFVLQTLLVTLFNAHQEFKKIVGIQIITNILLFISSFYFIYQQKLEGSLFAIAIADFISFFVAVFFVRKQFSFSFKFQSHYLKTISKFIVMALVSAILIPVTAILIRNYIIDNSSLYHAGIWEAISRISGFYMLFFSAGLSLYYLPKLSALKTDDEFKTELKYYFSILIPVFIGVLLLVFLLKEIIISIALTSEFKPVSELLIWQLFGDLFRVMTLAFGFQILVKTMIVKYIIVELFYNVCYLLFSFLLFDFFQVKGVLQAYLLTNALTFFMVLVMFRKTILKPTP